MPLSFTPLAPLEALACVRPMPFLSGVHFLTGSHCTLRPNTKGSSRSDRNLNPNPNPNPNHQFRPNTKGTQEQVDRCEELVKMKLEGQELPASTSSINMAAGVRCPF
jgi:hypothetical protein